MEILSPVSPPEGNYPPLPPPTKAYEGVKYLIQKLVGKMVRGNPGMDPDDLLGDAHLAFAQAYRSYNYRTKFSTWVYFNVNCALKDAKQRAHDRAKLEQGGERFFEGDLPGRRDFHLKKWAKELSYPARKVIRTILEPPLDVIVEAPQGYKGNSPRFLNAVEEYLRDLGWCTREITRALKEIWEALR